MRVFPSVAAAPPTDLAFIPAGPAGTRATLQRMAQLVREYRRHPLIRQLAVEIRQAARVPARNWYGELQALFQFVRGHITYVRDVREVETLQTPVRTLQNRAGDCDDQSILLASLLEALGHPTRFRAVRVAADPSRFSHVFTETAIGTRWVAADTTVPHPLGWRPPDELGRMIEHV